MQRRTIATNAVGGYSVIRSASFAKEGTSKKRPSPHLHKVPTRNNRVNPRTLQTALVSSIYLYQRAGLLTTDLMAC
jgi:hypothetical protein